MRRLVPALLAGLLAPACRTPDGLIYTHKVEPLTTNFHATPVVATSGKGDVKQLDYSYVRVLWSSNGIGEIAKQSGFQEVYYADLETLRILGIWTQQWAHVYGRK